MLSSICDLHKLLTEGKLILKICGKRANFLIYLIGKKKAKNMNLLSDINLLT